jgi:hypothetical protein
VEKNLDARNPEWFRDSMSLGVLQVTQSAHQWQNRQGMASTPIVFPPPPWINQDLALYHGTIATFASAIVAAGVRVSLGKPNTDFGPGFYTTTLKRQAVVYGPVAAFWNQRLTVANADQNQFSYCCI